jgi:hypothetical protein
VPASGGTRPLLVVVAVAVLLVVQGTEVVRPYARVFTVERPTAQLVAFFVHVGVDSKLACLLRFNLHSIGEISIVSVDRPFFHRQREHFTWPNNNVYKPAQN